MGGKFNRQAFSPGAGPDGHLLPLLDSQYGPIMANPKSPANEPPAISEWKQQEAAWNAQASAWVRDTLADYFSTDDRAFAPHTTKSVLEYLESKPTMPTAFARLVKSDTVSYNKRYEITRNALESLARHRQVAMGTTTNALGRERSTTYARPRDESDNWGLEIEASSPTVTSGVKAGVREWLKLDGGTILQGATRVVLTRKSRSGGMGEPDIGDGTGVSNRRKR